MTSYLDGGWFADDETRSLRTEVIDGAMDMAGALLRSGVSTQAVQATALGVRGFVALGSLIIAQRAFDAAVRYAKERTQFGKPIGQFQLIQDMIADMSAELDASRLLTYRALSMIDKGVRCSRESSIAKFYATEAGVRIASKAIQIHGAYGLSKEYPVERLFRGARMMTIPDGTTQIQKLIVGREILGMQAFI